MNASLYKGNTQTVLYDFTLGRFFPEEEEMTVATAMKRLEKHEEALLASASSEKGKVLFCGSVEYDFDRDIVTAVNLYDIYMNEKEFSDVIGMLPNSSIVYASFSTEKLVRRIRPCTLKVANLFISEHHRHNAPVTGMKFAIQLTQRGEDGSEEIIGVAICGRPVSRELDDGNTCEITRLCVTDGSNSACSLLYGACCRTAQGMGYGRIVTYTLSSEPGTSLRASNFNVEAQDCGGRWNSKRSRANREKNPDKLIPEEPKTRWGKTLQQKEYFVTKESICTRRI